jgi:hypothetical protein
MDNESGLARDLMARIFLRGAILAASHGQSNQDACRFARHALQAAYDSDLKQTIEGLIGQFRRRLTLKMLKAFVILLHSNGLLSTLCLPEDVVLSAQDLGNPRHHRN